MEEVREYKERLDGYKLGDYTKKQYIYYFKKLKKLIGDLEINEEISEAFLKDNSNSVCMAFLHDYFRWKKIVIVLDNRIVERTPKKQKSYITPEEIIILTAWLKEHYDYKFSLMLRLAYHCALRRKETIGLRLDFLTKDFKEWKEDQTKSLRMTIHKKSAKGEKERKAIVPPKLAKYLHRYIKKNLEKIRETKHKNNIFRVGETRWHKVFKHAVKEALGKNYILHELRFSKATYWYQKKGFDIVTIKKLLGHVDIGTTQRYIDPAQENALKLLEEIYNE